MLYLLSIDWEMRSGVALDARRPWFIRRLACASCGREVVNAGESYPCVDLTGHELASTLGRGSNDAVGMAEYRAICAALRPLVPRGALLRPGCHFGPPRGTIRGTIADFVSPLGDTWLVRESTLQALERAGVRWPDACPAPLRPMGRTEKVQLLELQLVPAVTLQLYRRNAAERICPGCQLDTLRRRRVAPKPLAYDPGTVPPGIDLFRVRNWLSQVVVTERFRTAAIEHGVVGVEFEPVPPKSLKDRRG